MLTNDPHDVLIQLVCRPRIGLWAHAKSFAGSRGNRDAGQLGTEASAHTLLAAGLTAALRSISKSQVERLSRRDQKLRVKVVTTDSTFVERLRELMQNVTPTKRLKAGSNFVHELIRHLSRFEINFVVEPESAALLTLGNWATHVVYPPSIVKVPLPFRSVATSQLLPS